MDRYLVISSDCHAGANGAEYRPYVDPAYRARFDDYLEATERQMRAMRAARGGDPEAAERQTELDPAATALWDMKLRLDFMEADGVVGEVIFPQPGGASGVPFFSLGHSFDIGDPELTAAGARAPAAVNAS